MRSAAHTVIAFVAAMAMVMGIAGLPRHAWAALEVASPFAIRDHVGPNTIGNIPGDRLVLGATDVRPSGDPTVVTATQGPTTVQLTFRPMALFPNQYVASVTFDPALTGTWTLNATRGSETATAVTNGIPHPQLVPLVNNLRVDGTQSGVLTPTLTWELPDLTSFNITRIRVRVIDAFNGNQLAQLAPLPPTATSVTIAAGTLAPTRAFVFRVMLDDVSEGFLQNRSNTFSAPYVLPPLSGVGAATIDGVLSPGEWDNAGRMDFPVLRPAHDGGSPFTATLYVMNDGTNLYVALRAPLVAVGFLTLIFDNHHDRVFQEGDDALGLVPGSGLADWHHTTRPPCQPGFFCLVPDEGGGGTRNGTGVVVTSADHIVYELAHPLNSGDPLDFSLVAGDEVGFRVQYSVTSLDPACTTGCFAGRLYPLAGPAVIRVAAAAPPVNRPPHAEAGEPQHVREGSPVVLDGRNSFDPDGDVLVYRWTQIAGPAVALADGETATPSFTAPLLPGGIGGETLAFLLEVSDSAFTTTDEVQVVVSQDNHAPVADAGAPQTVRGGRLVRLDGTASRDDDGDRLDFRWIQIGGPGVELVHATTASPTFTTPTVSEPTALTFRLSVSDSLLTATADVVVTVVNNPPLCELARAVPEVLWPPDHRMVPVVIVGVADPDDDRVALSVLGVTQDEPVHGAGEGLITPDAAISGGVLRLRSERSGHGNGRVYAVTFTADDGVGGQCTGIVRIGVPKSMKTSEIIDDGQRYDSLAPR